jgi:amidase
MNRDVVARLRKVTAALVLRGCLAAVLPAGATARQVTEPFDVVEATISDMQEAMAAGRVTAVELVDAYLARIAAYDQRGPALNAVIRLNPQARAEASALDAERARQGPRGPLHGIPIVLKDNYDMVGMPTTGGSIALAGLSPVDDGFQVRKLRDAGAIVIAKTNLHELAMGITTISGFGGQTRNPYDPTRNPGGSSGGTGAAVAASFAALGWGTDTCGSIRIPASHNNLFGLRPTKGLSSIAGILPLSHSQDTGGPLARTARDLAIGLDATVGADSADPATRMLDGRAVPRFVDALDTAALRGVRLGVLTSAFGESPEDRAMGDAVRAAIDHIAEAGAEVVDVSIPELDSLLEHSSVIPFEFKFDFIDYLAATPGAPVASITDILALGLYHDQLGDRFRARDSVETRDSERYRSAYAKRAEVRGALLNALDEQGLDALVYPTMRRPPARVDDPQFGSNCSMSAVSGLPALSVPAGFTDDGLPVGLELLGRSLSDDQLLGYGFAFEQLAHPRHAPFSTPPLVDGHAPPPVVFPVRSERGGGGAAVTGRATYDRSTGRMTYEIRVSGVSADEVHGILLHRMESDSIGPVIWRLSPPGQPAARGEITLRAGERDALLEKRLYVGLYTRAHPTGAARAVLELPAR